MPIQTINLGQYANDGSGDDLREAFAKVNANFALLGTDLPVAEAVNLSKRYTASSVVKTGSGPYTAVFTIAAQTTAPATNILYYVTGNTNPLYNGQFICTGSTFNTITLQYPTNPGIYSVITPTTISTAQGVFKSKNSTTLEFLGLKSTDGSVNIFAQPDSLDVISNVGIKLDPIQHKPALQQDLLLNNFVIRGANGTGDIDSTVNGIRVDVLNAVLGLILQSNQYTIDFGTIIGNYSVVNLDMGLFATPVGNSLDFGQL